ncbi:MAG TPA: VWA domain-containing protein [Vicinamibacterales bacterium]|nr:VWA domain-containing protein [Vicinamibacterales bacterium]
MRAPRHWLGLFACVLVCAAWRWPEQPRFSTGVDLTTFSVSAVDRRGGLVTGLTREDFEVIEDGKAQAIEFFAHGDGAAAPPMHVGLMVDASGSMERGMKLAQGAAIKFLNLLPNAADITLVDFDTQVRITRYPQRDFPRLVERIRQRKADGFTALYDALGTYLDGADGQDGRTVLVMYTDGGDTRSALSFSETLNLLKASNVTVYAIGLLEHAGSARLQLQMTLRQIAEVTGGQAFFPSGMDDIDGAYDKVLAEITSQYHLGYQSTATSTNGAWRKVEIKVKRPGIRVRSRQGYFGPYKPPGG